MKTRTLVFVATAVASLSMGCAGSPAAPFNQLAESPITVYRLQNYQDTAAAAPAAATPGTTGSIIPGLPGLPIPTEFQPQVQQAQSMICGFLPPGSPGCTPAGATAVPTTPAVQNAPLFQGYRIIGQAQVMDTKLRDDIIKIFGYEKSFDSKKSPCMFPELGMSFGAGGAQPPADVLVSFSCNQVQARNFSWPHPDNGMKDDTVKKLSAVVQKLFGGG